MPTYNIHLTIPELSLDQIVYSLVLPVIKFNDVDKTETLVLTIWNSAKSLNFTDYKPALLQLLESLI